MGNPDKRLFGMWFTMFLSWNPSVHFSLTSSFVTWYILSHTQCSKYHSRLIIKQIVGGHKREDGMLSDYCDGSVYHSHRLFSNVPSSLEILAYYDDVEVCNPLGSRSKKHKLGMYIVYNTYCLCNIYFVMFL